MLEDDRPLSAEAQAHYRRILSHAVVADLRRDADELSELCLEQPIPELASVSILKLYRLLLRERDRCHRLLALLSGSA